MRYELTQHARTVLDERGILLEWLEQVFERPERVVPDRDDPTLWHHLGAIAENGGRVLRVIINKDVSPPRIVSVYFDRTVRNKL